MSTSAFGVHQVLSTLTVHPAGHKSVSPIALKLSSGAVKVTLTWNSSPGMTVSGRSLTGLAPFAATGSMPAKAASKLPTSKSNNIPLPSLCNLCFILVSFPSILFSVNSFALDIQSYSLYTTSANMIEFSHLLVNTPCLSRSITGTRKVRSTALTPDSRDSGVVPLLSLVRTYMSPLSLRHQLQA